MKIVSQNQPRGDMVDEPRVDVVDEPRVDVVDEPRVDVVYLPRVDVAYEPRVDFPDSLSPPFSPSLKLKWWCALLCHNIDVFLVFLKANVADLDIVLRSWNFSFDTLTYCKFNFPTYNIS